MLRLGEAGIISTSMEGMLYGFSVFMFILTMWMLLRSRERRRMNNGMIIAACSLQILATAEFIVNIVRVCQGFLNIGPSLPRGPDQYFQDVSQPTFVVKSILYNIQTLILDGVVIYRTYVVWQSFYVVIVPVTGWIALFTSTIGTNIALATASEHSENIFAKQTGRWITAIYSTTLATNLSASSLLAFRIWQVSRQTARYRSSNRLAPILRIVIESGAIYSVTITAALISFVIGSPGVYVLLDMISPIISIVFNMIIIRVGMASDRSLPVVGSTNQNSTTAAPTEHRNNNVLRGYRPNAGYEMKSLTVEISQYFETDADSASVIDAERKRQVASNAHGADVSLPSDCSSTVPV